MLTLRSRSYIVGDFISDDTRYMVLNDDEALRRELQRCTASTIEMRIEAYIHIKAGSSEQCFKYLDSGNYVLMNW